MLNRLFKMFFSFCLFTLFVFLLLEFLLRAIGISYPIFHEAHETRGIALRAHAKGWQKVEGQAYIKINSSGFRDTEHPLKKPADTFRIAVLGDSMTEALQVPLNKTYCSLLQEELRHSSRIY